jgi:hypothetical protein
MDRWPANSSDAPVPQPDAPRPERRRSRTERRSSQRQPLRVAVRQLVISPDSDAAAPPSLALAQSSDLGLGGMRVWRRCSADDPALPVHTPVELAFELPGTRELVELRGEVVFDEPQGEGREYRATGVRFFELPAELQERLRGFLKDPP